MKRHTLILSDVQAALLLNAVQFAIVTLGRHPAYRGEKQVEACITGASALDSHDNETFSELHEQLLDMANDYKDPTLSSVDVASCFDPRTN